MARGQVEAPSSTIETGESVVGRGARVRGRITGDGDLRVEGSVEGDIAVSGEVALDDGSSVTGNIDAGAVVVAGGLAGDVITRGAITIRASAKVEGTMGGAEVSIEEGASFSGRIEAEFDLPDELETRQGR